MQRVQVGSEGKREEFTWSGNSGNIYVQVLRDMSKLQLLFGGLSLQVS
jgi:hypothetical protein